MWQYSAAGFFGVLSLTVSPWLAVPAAAWMLLAIDNHVRSAVYADDDSGEGE
jgi:hypothetical protein